MNKPSTLKFCLALLLVSAATVSADITKGIAGNWKANTTSYYDDGSFARSKGVIEFRRFNNGTLLMTEKKRVAGILYRIAQYWFYKNKTVDMVVYDRGNVVGEGSGSWDTVGRRLIFEMEIYTLTDTFTLDSTLSRVNPNKFVWAAGTPFSRWNSTLTK